MSFAAGYLTGLISGKAVERRKERSQFQEYLEQRGYTIIDRTGRPISLERVMKEAHPTQEKLGRKIVVVGVVLVAAAVITGGSAWIVLSVI